MQKENTNCVYCQREVDEADGDYIVMASFFGVIRRAHEECQEFAELLTVEALGRVQLDCTCDPCQLQARLKQFCLRRKKRGLCETQTQASTILPLTIHTTERTRTKQ